VDDLNSGRTDVALIPVIHLFTHPEVVMLDGLGVAADGPVKSVLLKCNRPIDQIKTVARDPASATSNALAELLLEKHFGKVVEMHDFLSLENPDAAVVIGDHALCSDPAPAGDIDLAEAWKAMTGLPFVFAVWAVRRDFSDIPLVTEIAHRAVCSAYDSIDKIAGRYTAELGRTPSFWIEYLSHTIRYELSSRDLEGLEGFRNMLPVMAES